MSQQSTMPKKILIVDDETLGVNEHKTFLEKQGMTVLTAQDYASALYLYNQNMIEVALVALQLKDMTGLTLIQKFRTTEILEKKCGGFILMAKGRERQATETNVSKELGGIEIVAKPFKTVSILGHLNRAYSKRNVDINIATFKLKVLNYHKEKHDFDKAIEAVKKKMPEFGARGPELLLGVYEEAEKYPEATTLVSSMLERPEYKGDIKLVNLKGRLMMKLGRFAEAKECYELADKLAPKNMERVAQMAAMYLELKDPKKSVEKMKDLMQMNPDNPAMKFDMFAQLQQHGFDADAIAFCQETTKPDEVIKHYNNKGVSQAKSGDQPSALKSYEEALKFYPEFAENYRIHYNLALGLLKSEIPDRVVKAISELEKALKLSPGYEKAKELLVRLRQGNTSAAA